MSYGSDSYYGGGNSGSGSSGSLSGGFGYYSSTGAHPPSAPEKTSSSAMSFSHTFASRPAPTGTYQGYQPSRGRAAAVSGTQSYQLSRGGYQGYQPRGGTSANIRGGRGVAASPSRGANSSVSAARGRGASAVSFGPRRGTARGYGSNTSFRGGAADWRGRGSARGAARGGANFSNAKKTEQQTKAEKAPVGHQQQKQVPKATSVSTEQRQTEIPETENSASVHPEAIDRNLGSNVAEIPASEDKSSAVESNGTSLKRKLEEELMTGKDTFTDFSLPPKVQSRRMHV